MGIKDTAGQDTSWPQGPNHLRLKTTGSVRRLLALPGYENITVELPLDDDSELTFWNTVRLVNERLMEWVLYINSGRTVAQGKSAFDQLSAELSYVNGKIGQLQSINTK